MDFLKFMKFAIFGNFKVASYIARNFGIWIKYRAKKSIRT